MIEQKNNRWFLHSDGQFLHAQSHIMAHTLAEFFAIDSMIRGYYVGLWKLCRKNFENFDSRCYNPGITSE